MHASVWGETRIESTNAIRAGSACAVLGYDSS